MLIVLACVVLLVVGGGGAFFAWRMKQMRASTTGNLPAGDTAMGTYSCDFSSNATASYQILLCFNLSLLCSYDLPGISTLYFAQYSVQKEYKYVVSLSRAAKRTAATTACLTAASRRSGILPFDV